MVEGVTMGLSDSWVWLVFVGIGLLMILLDLIVGVGGVGECLDGPDQ